MKTNEILESKKNSKKEHLGLWSMWSNSLLMREYVSSIYMECHTAIGSSRSVQDLRLLRIVIAAAKELEVSVTSIIYHIIIERHF